MIIGIVGRAGCGKDTAAGHLVTAHGLTQLSMASPLKVFCEKAFNLSFTQVWGASERRNELKPINWTAVMATVEKEGLPWVQFLGGGVTELHTLLDKVSALSKEHPTHISARTILQFMGTEFAREAFGEDIWVDIFLRKAAFYIKEGRAGVVASDVRFLNEMEGVRKGGGRLLRIDRDSRPALTNGITNHPSEGVCDTLPCDYFDSVINNNKDIQALYDALDVFMTCQHD